MNSEINYAYKSGVLKGTLESLSSRYSIPGVEIIDYKLFREFIKSEIDSAEKLTKEYSSMISSK
jgi:hypothetical protein